MLDREAITWAIRKLTAFGVANNTAENAAMMDRLEAVLNDCPSCEQGAMEQDADGLPSLKCSRCGFHFAF